MVEWGPDWRRVRASSRPGERDLESWAPSLDPDTWPETVYHFECPLVDSSHARPNGVGPQPLGKQWNFDREAWIIETSLGPHAGDQGQRHELHANYRILNEATRQLERMLSGLDNTKIVASMIMSRLDHVEKTLLSCTTVIGRCFLNRQTSELWTKKEKVAFCHKFHVSTISWSLEDILGG